MARCEEAINASNEQYCEVPNGDDPPVEVIAGQTPQRQQHPWQRRVSSADLDTSTAIGTNRISVKEQRESSDPTVAECLGYFEHGRSSLLDIMKDVCSGPTLTGHACSPTLSFSSLDMEILRPVKAVCVFARRCLSSRNIFSPFQNDSSSIS